MDRIQKAVRWDGDAMSVVVETVSTDGAKRLALIDIDVAQAVVDMMQDAAGGAAPVLRELDGTYSVAGFSGEAFDQEFHLRLQTASGEVATFAFAAPGKSQSQVADVSESIRDAVMRLLPKAN